MASKKSAKSARKSSAKSSSKKSAKSSQQAQAREAAAQPAGQRRAPLEHYKVGDEVTVNLERIPQAEFNDHHRLALNRGLHGRQGRVVRLEGEHAFVEGETMSAGIPVDILDRGHLELFGHGRARKSSRKAPKAAKKGKAAGNVRVASQSAQADVAPAGRG